MVPPLFSRKLRLLLCLNHQSFTGPRNKPWFIFNYVIFGVSILATQVLEISMGYLILVFRSSWPTGPRNKPWTPYFGVILFRANGMENKDFLGGYPLFRISWYYDILSLCTIYLRFIESTVYWFKHDFIVYLSVFDKQSSSIFTMISACLSIVCPTILYCFSSSKWVWLKMGYLKAQFLFIINTVVIFHILWKQLCGFFYPFFRRRCFPF